MCIYIVRSDCTKFVLKYYAVRAVESETPTLNKLNARETHKAITATLHYFFQNKNREPSESFSWWYLIYSVLLFNWNCILE